MLKTVVAFVRDGRRERIAVDCPGLPPNPPSHEEFEAAARDGMIAAGALTALEATAAKFVVQD